MTRKKRLGNLGLLKLAWANTRGVRGVCYGPEFFLVLFVWVLTSPYWLFQSWWDQVISTLPTILGFTVSGFAIFLGFGSDDFKRFLSKGESLDDNSYLSVGAAFVVFITTQLIAIFFALIVKAYQFPTPNFLIEYKEIIKIGSYFSGGVGYFLFLYSLALALRASLRIFRLSRWYAGYLRATDKSKSK